MITPKTHDALALKLLDEAAKTRKLEILFGPWWRHYAIPYEFPATLYVAQSTCPYCDGRLGPLPILEPDAAQEGQTAHLDHMDPLSRGGEDSIRNAVYVCARCNLAKGKRLFVTWLGTLPPDGQDRARAIYTEKHSQPPEAFQPGPRQARLDLPRRELQLNESVLHRLFPRPIVDGPPRTATATTHTRATPTPRISR